MPIGDGVHSQMERHQGIAGTVCHTVIGPQGSNVSHFEILCMERKLEKAAWSSEMQPDCIDVYLIEHGWFLTFPVQHISPQLN